MVIRRVKQQSDRGSIKDLQDGDDEKLPPTEDELRIKSLYEHALANRDQALIDSLGLIPANGSITDPVSLYRHREYIQSLSIKLAEQIEKTKQELLECFPEAAEMSQEKRALGYKQIMARSQIMSECGDFIKIADRDGNEYRRHASFRRVVR